MNKIILIAVLWVMFFCILFFGLTFFIALTFTIPYWKSLVIVVGMYILTNWNLELKFRVRT